MPILERFFLPDRDEIWEQLAEEIGGNFYDGGFWLGDSKVRAHVGDWIVTLDTYKDASSAKHSINFAGLAPQLMTIQVSSFDR